MAKIKTYTKEEIKVLKKIAKTPKGAWASKLRELSGTSGRSVQALYYKISTLNDPNYDKNKVARKAKYQAKKRSKRTPQRIIKNHRKMLQKGELLVNQKELRFPISSLAIERVGEDYEFVVRM